MTAEHLKGILESEADMQLLAELASSLSQADVSLATVSAGLGRVTALEKPDNGVRGIVVGDFFRRLVARTLAQQFAENAKEATAPFQFASENPCRVRSAWHTC